MDSRRGPSVLAWSSASSTTRRPSSTWPDRPRRAAGPEHRDRGHRGADPGPACRRASPGPRGCRAGSRRSSRASEIVGTAMRTAPFGDYPAYLMPMPDEARAPAGRDAARPWRAGPGGERRAAGGPDLLRGHGCRHRQAGAGRPAHPPLRARRPGRAAARSPGGCARPRSTSSRWSPPGTTRSWPTPTSRRAASRGSRRTSRPTEDEMSRRIESGRVFVWVDDDDGPVNVTAATAPAYGVSADRAGLHAPGAAGSRATPARAVYDVSALLREQRRAAVPVHRPGQPDVEQDLRGDRLPAGRRHGESARGVTAH